MMSRKPSLGFRAIGDLLRQLVPKSPEGLALFAVVAFVAHLAIEGAIVLLVLYVVAR